MYATHMQDKMLEICDRQIQSIKDQLAALGPLRPGSLTRQYRQPRRRQGAYYQISYTLRMRSHTDYVRSSEVAQLRQEIAAYRRFRQLTARWVQVALRRSRWVIRRARSLRVESNLTGKPSLANVGGSKRKKAAKTG
jgi:hypothetical protein